MEHVRSKILDVRDLDFSRLADGVVGLCTGCFDVMHSGHLVVVVGSDRAVASQKEGRPVNPESNRAYLAAGLEMVDFVFVGDDNLLPGNIDCASVVDKVRPDIYILNSDDRNVSHKKEFCIRNGMRLELVDRTVPEYLTATSTTDIIVKVSSSKMGNFI